MPRRKSLPKFKYTARKGSDLYVRYPLPDGSGQIWRKCFPETQGRVDEIIGIILESISAQKAETDTPERCDRFFDFWLSFIKDSISQRTYQNRETVIRLHLMPALGFWQVSEVRPVQLQMIYSEMLARGFAPVTIRKVHAVASSIFKEAVALGLIAQNPASRAKPPKLTDNLKVKTIAPEQIKAFLTECGKSPHGIIFEFALETGMRPQEYLALRWTDIDLKKQTASVVRALVYDRKGGGWYFKEPKTKKSRRIIPLSKNLCEKLQIHLDNQTAQIAEVEAKIKKRYKPSRVHFREHNKQILKNHAELNLVFPSSDHTPQKDINLGRRYFKPLAKAAGLSSDLTLYCLRHSSISLMMLAGVNLKVIAERAGHSNPTMILTVYAHVFSGEQEKATDKLSDLLYG